MGLTLKFQCWEDFCDVRRALCLVANISGLGTEVESHERAKYNGDHRIDLPAIILKVFNPNSADSHGVASNNAF